MRTCLIALYLLISYPLIGAICESHTIADVLQHANEKTLIVFDIDNTIYEPVQMLGSDQWFYHHLEKLKASGVSHHEALQQSLHLWHKIQHVTRVQLMETHTPEIIQKLQESNFSVMALTTRGHEIADATLRQLASHSIDMRKTAPDSTDYYLQDMPHVLWKGGVLLTKGLHKGKAFLAFLKQSGFTPKRVVFINDKASHIRELEESSEAVGIEFLGLRYSGSDEKVKNFLPHVAHVQLLHFEDILPDAAVEAIINHKS
ncbi:MAG: putative rane protein [Chlamydiia bacterium]|nr:putative rane protein [Chlamydiia bacterium]